MVSTSPLHTLGSRLGFSSTRLRGPLAAPSGVAALSQPLHDVRRLLRMAIKRFVVVVLSTIAAKAAYDGNNTTVANTTPPHVVGPQG
jgi:hypothetical protein